MPSLYPKPHALAARAASGMTLIEVLFAVAFLTVAFVSLYGLFQASLRFVSVAKAREGALSLAVERMESLRALPYSALGTVGGIPSGSIPQQETVALDAISYTRRTLIQYVDDPADGAGQLDSNANNADYKRAKVEVSWATTAGTTSVAILSNFIPTGLEGATGGGTLSVIVFDATGAAVPDATVHIQNITGTTTVDVTTYTNSAGTVLFPGTPSATGYQIFITKPGYSAAQTYSVTSQNPNPDPGNLSITTGQTTSASFSIDLLASLRVNTWRPVFSATTTDTFVGDGAIASSSNTTVAGGALSLSGPVPYPQSGVAYSTTTAPSYLSSWTALSWNGAQPAGTAASVRLYTTDGGGQYSLVPDSVLSGNSAGFTSSPVILSSVPAVQYPSLVIGARLSTADPSATPTLLDWSLSYRQGPIPFSNATFSLHGGKTIGTTGSGAAIYKTNATYTTDSNTLYQNNAIEWDSYTFSVASTTGFDLASACPSQPTAVSPGSSVSAELYLSPHTANTLLVSVRNATSSAPVRDASVTLTRTGFSALETTDSCGNAFFGSLASGSSYSLLTSASGYTATTTNNVTVSGQSTVTVAL